MNNRQSVLPEDASPEPSPGISQSPPSPSPPSVTADSDSDGDVSDIIIVRTVSSRAGTGTVPSEPGPPPENAADLERLDRTVSGPVYTIFSRRTKILVLTMITITGFISPMTANIYYPALDVIAGDLGVSIGLINLTLTTYMILQGIAPTLFGDFGDMAGRRPAIIIALVIYLFANIGLALQNNFAALLILRMMQSGGSSGTLALSYAVVADMTVSAERGKYMSIVGMGINVGPAISPVLGGILSEYLGWRAVFWFCCIFGGSVLLMYVSFVPETSRNVVGNGSIRPRWFNRSLLDFIRLYRERRHPDTATPAPAPPKNKIRFPNPLRTLAVVFEKDIFLILIYTAMMYVVFMVCVATLSTIFADLYNLNDLEVGLCYLPYGFGCLLSTFGQGYVLDWNYRRIARKIGFTIDRKRGDNLAKYPIEYARIQPMIPLMLLGVAAVVTYGWVLEYKQPLGAALVVLVFIGIGITGSFGILSTLIVDLHPQAPATAVAGVNLMRCLWGAGAMAFIQPMLTRLGRGWTFTLWALLCLGMSPILWVVNRYGPRWREERRLRLEKKEVEAKEAKKRRELEKKKQRQSGE